MPETSGAGSGTGGARNDRGGVGQDGTGRDEEGCELGVCSVACVSAIKIMFPDPPPTPAPREQHSADQRFTIYPKVRRGGASHAWVSQALTG